MTRSTTMSATTFGDNEMMYDDGGVVTSTQRYLIPSDENPQIVNEVNEYLSRAIDARNIERLKNENIRPITLKFRDGQLERKVCNFGCF